MYPGVEPQRCPKVLPVRFRNVSCLFPTAHSRYPWMNADAFALFDLSIHRRGRAWRWSIIDRSGNPLLIGSEFSRTAAHYSATRAIFQMLLDRSLSKSNVSSGLVARLED